MEEFTFQPDESWTKQFDVDFQTPEEQIKEFYIQGWADAVKPKGSTEGLLIETPNIPYGADAYTKQVYIWSNKTFEGNIYVEFEWKALKPNGLSLLMIHASGMGREDFMADYPKKTSGTMLTVHGENVRNYHWEFYREMNDVRNDVGTAFSRKNPFAYRNSFKSARLPSRLTSGTSCSWCNKMARFAAQSMARCCSRSTTVHAPIPAPSLTTGILRFGAWFTRRCSIAI